MQDHIAQSAPLKRFLVHASIPNHVPFSRVPDRPLQGQAAEAHYHESDRGLPLLRFVVSVGPALVEAFWQKPIHDFVLDVLDLVGGENFENLRRRRHLDLVFAEF